MPDPPLGKRYTLRKDAPPPAGWDAYASRTLREWEKLRSSPAASDEAAIHDFLERHPSMLPDIVGPWWHSPFLSAVISKPQLPGLKTREPDFLIFAQNSGQLVPVFVEIEVPTKQFFTKKGQARAELVQALNQIQDWRIWLEVAGHREIFNRLYQLPPRLQYKTFTPRYVLLYGSRAELEADDWRNAKRVKLEPPNGAIRTFDALAPSMFGRDLISVRCDADDGYTALYLPPTYRMGPYLADVQSSVKGKIAAVNRSPDFSRERKRFLQERLPYWDEWGQGEPTYLHSGDSWE
jgi:hypothetical protein